MKCLRTTSIHGEVDSESVLMNILLRNFMHNNLLDQGMEFSIYRLILWTIYTFSVYIYACYVLKIP